MEPDFLSLLELFIGSIAEQRNADIRFRIAQDALFGSGKVKERKLSRLSFRPVRRVR